MVRGILIHGPERDKEIRTSSDIVDTLFFSAWFDSECNKNKKSREAYVLNEVRKRCTFERNSFSLLSESERSKLPSFMEEEDDDIIRLSGSPHRTSKASTPMKSHIVRFRKPRRLARETFETRHAPHRIPRNQFYQRWHH